MARIALGQLGFDKILPAARGDFGPEFLPQLFVERPVAPEESRFQQRCADGDVLFGEAQSIREQTRRVADLQAQVPQHVQDEFDDALAPGGLLERADEQQIDIGSRRQHSAAIAAGGHDREAFGSGRIWRRIEMLHREIIENLDRSVLKRRQGPSDSNPGTKPDSMPARTFSREA